MRRLFFAVICAVSVMPAQALERADTGRPKWEAGVALAGLYYPHYLGADQEQAYLLPLPYFVYRGEYVQADGRGLRGYLYESPNLDLRLSLRGSLPVSSEDNDARKGMKDLDLLLEAGPNLQYRLYDTPRQMLRVDFPVRAAFSVGDKFFNHEGWTSTPGLHHELYLEGWTVTSELGVVFSDSRYHGYIYNVDRKYVTADRPYYQSKAGYTGARFSVGMRKRIGDYFLGAKATYYNLNGAVNEDSPLLMRDDYFALSLFFAWVLSESPQRVAGP